MNCSLVTGYLPSANALIETTCCGPSLSNRPLSPAGLPMTKLPAGTPIIFGQSLHSWNSRSPCSCAAATKRTEKSTTNPMAIARARIVKSQTRVNGIDQGSVTRVLPTRAHIVGDVTKRNACFGVAEPHGSARTEMTEGTGVRSERPFGLCELKSEAEARWPLRDKVFSRRLFSGCKGQCLCLQYANVVDHAAIGEGCIDTRNPPRRSMAIGRWNLGQPPSRAVDPTCS